MDKEVIALEQAKIQLARMELKYFSEYCWKGVDPEHKPNGWFHEEWYDLLQGNHPEAGYWEMNRRLHIQAPREHAKTTCLSVKYPLWRFGRNPNLRILLVSKSATLSHDILGEVRRNIDINPKYQQVFPEVLPDLPWTDTEFRIKRSRIDKTPTMRGVGLHGTITGGRADLIILDDPFDEAEVRTDNQREKVETWIEKVVIPVLTPTGQLIAIGTRWHYADYWENLMRKTIVPLKVGSKTYEPGGNYLVKIYRPTENMNDPKSPMKSIWPEVWDMDHLLERKQEIGTIRFNCLMLNDPSGYEGLIFKEEWLRYYNPHELRFIENMIVIMGVDPSISEDPTSDYFAMVVIGVNPYGGNMYLLDMWRDRIEFPEQVRVIRRKYDEYMKVSDAFGWTGGVTVIGIESVAYQRALAKAVFMQGLPVREIKTTTDKVTRMVGLTPHFEGGRFYLPNPKYELVGWLQPFIDEYVAFPRGEFDDQLDAVDMAFQCTQLSVAERRFYFG